MAAIVALGMKTHFRQIAEIGWKSVLLMVLETLLIAVLVLVAISAGWI